MDNNTCMFYNHVSVLKRLHVMLVTRHLCYVILPASLVMFLSDASRLNNAAYQLLRLFIDLYKYII
jgi:hypothetical protein